MLTLGATREAVVRSKLTRTGQDAWTEAYGESKQDAVNSKL
jgi:hypothetical protein